jgi:hypothetical protein
LGIINPVVMTATAREMSVMACLARSYCLFGTIFRKDHDGYHLRWVRLILIHALFPTLAGVAAYFDHTARLLPNGRGLVEHYGFHALFLSAPVLVYLTWRVVTSLAKIIAEPLPWLSPTPPPELSDLQHTLQNSVLCRSAKAKGFLLMMRMVGVFAFLANADNTRRPELVYGQDVFDSSRHLLGYFAGRLFLGYYWIYLLPLIAYIAFATVAVTIRLAAYVDELPDYDVSCFASDGCGGFKELGRLMTLVVYLWVPIVVVVIALMETHTNFYATLKLSVALVVIIPAQLFLPFARLHRVLTRLKARKLATLERFLTATERAINVKAETAEARPEDPTERRAIEPYLRLLAGESVYRHTSEMATWPYIKSDVMRWLTPFVPIAVSFAFKRLGWP